MYIGIVLLFSSFLTGVLTITEQLYIGDGTAMELHFINNINSMGWIDKYDILFEKSCARYYKKYYNNTNDIIRKHQVFKFHCQTGYEADTGKNLIYFRYLNSKAYQPVSVSMLHCNCKYKRLGSQRGLKNPGLEALIVEQQLGIERGNEEYNQFHWNYFELEINSSIQYLGYEFFHIKEAWAIYDNSF